MRFHCVLMLAACGRVGFDPRTDAAGTVDRPCVLPTITFPPPPVTAFGTPAEVPQLHMAGTFDDDPTLTGDELEIIFQRGGAPAVLFRSVRAAKTDPWAPPQEITELSPFLTNTPELSRDGLRLWLAISAQTGGDQDLYLSTRADRSSPWGAPVRVDALSTSMQETASAEFLDGTAVVFGSTRAGGSPSGSLWEAIDDDCNAFTTASISTLTGGVSDPGTANPWMRNDGLAVVYPGTGTAGASDLLVATRLQIGQPFGTPVELSSLNTAAVEDDPWLNDAMDTIYFGTSRTGEGVIHSATR